MSKELIERHYSKILPISLISVFLLWWFFMVFKPYLKKSNALNVEINTLNGGLEFEKLEQTYNLINDYIYGIDEIRSQLLFDNLLPFVNILKEETAQYGLSIKRFETAQNSLYSSCNYMTKINTKSLIIELTGDFISIGRFVQSIEEAYNSCFYIRNMIIEKVSDDGLELLTKIKMDVFLRGAGKDFENSF